MTLIMLCLVKKDIRNNLKRTAFPKRSFTDFPASAHCNASLTVLDKPIYSPHIMTDGIPAFSALAFHTTALAQWFWSVFVLAKSIAPADPTQLVCKKAAVSVWPCARLRWPRLSRGQTRDWLTSENCFSIGSKTESLQQSSLWSVKNFQNSIHMK